MAELSLRDQVIHGAMTATAREVGARLKRAAHSSLIRESDDYGAAIVSHSFDLLAEAETTPLQMGPLAGYCRGMCAALAASGTVALELAVARTPAVIAYKTNILTALIARWLVKARFAHLVNLILEREAIPEFLQGACRSEFLAAAMEDLLADTERRDKQIFAYDEALKELKPKGDSPAALAAGVVINAITEKGTPE